jgi:hypothetical protein
MNSGLRGCRRTYHTILKLADHALPFLKCYLQSSLDHEFFLLLQIPILTIRRGVRVARSYNSIYLACAGRHSAQPVQKLAATPEMLSVTRHAYNKNDVLGFGSG